jgi:hypothetical protein
MEVFLFFITEYNYTKSHKLDFILGLKLKKQVNLSGK